MWDLVWAGQWILKCLVFIDRLCVVRAVGGVLLIVLDCLYSTRGIDIYIPKFSQIWGNHKHSSQQLIISAYYAITFKLNTIRRGPHSHGFRLWDLIWLDRGRLDLGPAGVVDSSSNSSGDHPQLYWNNSRWSAKLVGRQVQFIPGGNELPAGDIFGKESWATCMSRGRLGYAIPERRIYQGIPSI